MSAGLALVTGATGHLGFRVLVEALQAGYHVRAPVRRTEQVALIKAAPSVQPYLSKLDFVVVPDIGAPGAYDEAVQGVTFIIHVASPLAVPSENYNRDIIEPAVRGTTGVLNSALKVPTVKRVVITSSLNALIAWGDLMGPDSEKVWTDQDKTVAPQGPYNHFFEAYSASKVFALHATEEFVATNKPSFDIINIMPTFIIGKNELVTDLKDIQNGTNAFALAPIVGKKNPPTLGVTIYLNDVAKIHVLALDEKILKPGSYENFMVSSGGVEGTNFDDGLDIVKKNFAEQVEKGILPLGGTQPSKKLRVSSERTEKIFGIKLADYETQIKSVVQHYVDLAAAGSSL